MVRLVSGDNSLPPVSGPGLSSPDNTSGTGLDRVGVVGLDLLGGGAGVAGGAVKNTIGLLGEVVNTPFEVVSGEVAQNRLASQLAGNKMGISQRYIDMVKIDGMSISDVADQMANDGVGISNNIAHELMLSVFMDPFNLIAAGAGKGFDVGKRSADIQEKISNTTVDSVASSAVRYGATEDEVRWLKGPGRELLGKMYSKTARGLGGVKRGVATAMLGRGAGIAATIVGVKFLANAIDIAKNYGKSQEILDAVAVGTNHVTLGAAADVVTNRVFGQSRASIMEKAKIIDESKGVDDTEAFDRFLRISVGSPESAGDSLDFVRTEWETLHRVADEAGSNRRQAVTQNLFDRNVAGEINEQVGKTGVLSILEAERTLDEVAIARRVEDQKAVAVDEAMFLLSGASDDAGRIALARAEFVQNIGPIIGMGAAEEIWNATLKTMDLGKQSTLRALGEAIYASEVMRLGFVAKAFGAAKKSLVSKLANSELLGRLPAATRAMVQDSERWTIVARDTMTNLDHKKTIDVLAGEGDAVAKGKAALYAVKRFSILRNQYEAKAFAKLVEADPQKAVDMLLDTLRQYGDDAFLKEVPITEFKGVDDVLPEIADMARAAERGEYRIAYEPKTAASIPNRVYQNAATKDVARFGVDLWVPITDNAIDVTIGNRNLFGQALDILAKERRTITVISNTLTRMQEYVVAKNVPLSRNQVRRLHTKLTDRGYEMKGSIRTATDEVLSANTNTIIDDLIEEARQVNVDDANRLRQMKQSGELRSMIFVAAAGDLQNVGLTTYITGRIKAAARSEMVSKIPDLYYPALKFQLSPIFGIQEVVESKYWNAIRGYGSEMSLGNALRKAGIDSKAADDIRLGTKRFYDVEIDGKVERLDSVDIIRNLYVSERQELKFAQEMNAINMYYAGNTTDAILRFGSENESFAKGLKEAFYGPQNAGKYKALDWYKFVTTESLDDISGDLARRFEEVAPVQWATWLKMAGGDRRGASLLMIRERQALIRGRQSARAYLEASKPMGMGFGRQYDDAPVKNLDATVRELTKQARSSDPNVRNKALDDLDKRLSVIHAEAATIGYSIDSLNLVVKAKEAVDAARTGGRLTVKNKLTKKATESVNAALESVDAARTSLRAEFEVAVKRKQIVRDTLMADGIAKPLATEMAALFVVAEKRAEMVPQVSIAINKALKGEQVSPEILDKLKDQLIQIRGARAPEETLWNAIIHSIDAAAANADRTHFFNPGRSFLERSLNHPVFALYPSSYMFGKVLPEYSRMLYLSPTRGVSGVILAPWMAILRAMGGQRFSPENWGKYAPLVGFNAAMNIREAMVDSMGTDQDLSKNPLVYFFANTLIPGLPTEISVSASKPVRGVVSDVMEGKVPDIGTLGYNIAEQTSNIVGVSRAIKEGFKIADFLATKSAESGGPIQLAGNAIGDAVESLGDIIRPK
jgi:hypothetical protein